jgi:hypothetical protein
MPEEGPDVPNAGMLDCWRQVKHALCPHTLDPRPPVPGLEGGGQDTATVSRRGSKAPARSVDAGFDARDGVAVPSRACPTSTSARCATRCAGRMMKIGLVGRSERRDRAIDAISPETGTIPNRNVYKPESDRERVLYSPRLDLGHRDIR